MITLYNTIWYTQLNTLHHKLLLLLVHKYNPHQYNTCKHNNTLWYTTAQIQIQTILTLFSHTLLFHPLFYVSNIYKHLILDIIHTLLLFNTIITMLNNNEKQYQNKKYSQYYIITNIDETNLIFLLKRRDCIIYLQAQPNSIMLYKAFHTICLSALYTPVKRIIYYRLTKINTGTICTTNYYTSYLYKRYKYTIIING